MPVQPQAPARQRNSQITTASGLILPPSAAGTNLAAPLDAQTQSTIASLSPSYGHQQPANGFNNGFRLTREEETQVICWPAKGSGWDDWTLSQIVDGNVANVGIAPAVSSLFMSAVYKQSAQAMSGEIILTGKNSPVKMAREGMRRFNDCPLGVAQGLAQFTYQFLTFNRGAPLATIPITQPSAEWASYGITPVPLLAQGQKENEADLYYLEVDWAQVGRIVPYMPSVFDLEPTGNNEWPYWYRVEVGGRDVWVLLHGSQILPLTPGYSTKPGVGTSSAWMCTEQLAMYVLALDAEAEQIVAAPTDGILMLSGLSQNAKQVMEAIQQSREAGKAAGRAISKGYTAFVAKDAIDIKSFSFRNAEKIDQEWITRFEDRVATNFRMSLADLGISRPGVGYSAQSETTRDMAADSGVGYVLAQFAMAAGAIYPRVQVSVTRPNDYARVRLLEDFDKFSNAVARLPVGVLSAAEIRAMLENQVGIKIPATEDNVTTSTSPTADATNDGTGKNAQDGQGGTGDSNTPQSAGNGQGGATVGEGGQPQAGTLAAWVDGLLLAARQLRVQALGTVEDALASGDYKKLVRAIAEALGAQYESADVGAIIRDMRAAGIEPDAPGATGQIAELVRKHTKKIKDGADLPLIVSLLLALAVQGRVEAEDQAAAVDRALTEAQQARVDRQSERDLSDRVDELFVEATGDGAAGDSQPLDDQTAPDTLDEESYAVIAGLVRGAVVDNTDDDGAAADAARAGMGPAAKSRADWIATAEGIRAFNIGLSRGAVTLKATRKRWLLSAAVDKRDIHLEQVGDVVGINEKFADGSKWAGELYGCLCGTELLFD